MVVAYTPLFHTTVVALQTFIQDHLTSSKALVTGNQLSEGKQDFDNPTIQISRIFRIPVHIDVQCHDLVYLQIET